MVTYNDAISVRHPLPSLDGLTGAVSAEELFAFVDRSSADTISLDVNEGELRVKAGRAKVGLKLAAEVLFPLDETQVDGKWFDVPEDFLDGLQMALYAVSKDASMPSLTCIHIHGDHIESSDNIRLTRYICAGKVGLGEVLLPAKAAEELVQYEVKKCSLGNKGSWAHFLVEGDAVFSARLVKAKYPTLTPILKVDGASIPLPKKIGGVLNKAGVFSKREHALDQEVDITIETRRMVVKAKSDLGWFEEEVGIRYEGEPASFSVHPGFLADACEREATCTLSPNRMKFESDKWTHVIALKGN